LGLRGVGVVVGKLDPATAKTVLATLRELFEE
jgi:hypothetical protein